MLHHQSSWWHRGQYCMEKPGPQWLSQNWIYSEESDLDTEDVLEKSEAI